MELKLLLLFIIVFIMIRKITVAGKIAGKTANCEHKRVSENCCDLGKSQSQSLIANGLLMFRKIQTLNNPL